MSTLHLASGCSPEYLPHAAAMIHSVAEHRGALGLDVHLLHGPALPAADRTALRAFVDDLGASLHLHELADERIAGLPAMEHIPATMWYRTFLPDLLPGIGRVLYLDADTIAVDSLEPLWSTDLGDHLLAAVTNVWEPWNEGYPVGGLGLPDRDAYFNSGVLLMDLDALRTGAWTQRVLDWARARGPLPWGDQDALNAVLGHRRLALHPRWNCMNSVLTFPQAAEVFGDEAVAAARARPGIRHFEGPLMNKPWHAGCEHALRELYLRHRRATPWPEVAVEGVVASRRRMRPRLATAARRLRRLRASVSPSSGSDAPPPDAADGRMLATADEVSRRIVAECLPMSITSAERVLAVVDAVRYVVARGIEGDFVECGVWRGGSVVAMIRALQHLGVEDRGIWLYDTFEGMTEPTALDTSPVDRSALEYWHDARAADRRVFDEYFDPEKFNEDVVRETVLATGYPSERLHFVKGRVEDTLPGQAPERIAFLRLDTDWYESTRHELLHLYPRLSDGGVLIVDDYGHWEGARRAVDEYFATEAPPPLLSRIDYTGRIGVKQAV